MGIPQLLADAATDGGSSMLIVQLGSTAVLTTMGFLIKREIKRFDATTFQLTENTKLLSRRLNRNCRRLKQVEEMVKRIPKLSEADETTK